MPLPLAPDLAAPPATEPSDGPEAPEAPEAPQETELPVPATSAALERAQPAPSSPDTTTATAPSAGPVPAPTSATASPASATAQATGPQAAREAVVLAAIADDGLKPIDLSVLLALAFGAPGDPMSPFPLSVTDLSTLIGPIHVEHGGREIEWLTWPLLKRTLRGLVAKGYVDISCLNPQRITWGRTATLVFSLQEQPAMRRPSWACAFPYMAHVAVGMPLINARRKYDAAQLAVRVVGAGERTGVLRQVPTASLAELLSVCRTKLVDVLDDLARCGVLSYHRYALEGSKSHYYDLTLTLPEEAAVSAQAPVAVTAPALSLVPTQEAVGGAEAAPDVSPTEPTPPAGPAPRQAPAVEDEPAPEPAPTPADPSVEDEVSEGDWLESCGLELDDGTAPPTPATTAPVAVADGAAQAPAAEGPARESTSTAAGEATSGDDLPSEGSAPSPAPRPKRQTLTNEQAAALEAELRTKVYYPGLVDALIARAEEDLDAGRHITPRMRVTAFFEPALGLQERWSKSSPYLMKAVLEATAKNCDALGNVDATGQPRPSKWIKYAEKAANSKAGGYRATVRPGSNAEARFATSPQALAGAAKGKLKAAYDLNKSGRAEEALDVLGELLGPDLRALAPVIAGGDVGQARTQLIECFKRGSSDIQRGEAHPTEPYAVCNYLPDSTWPHADTLPCERAQAVPSPRPTATAGASAGGPAEAKEAESLDARRHTACTDRLHSARGLNDQGKRDEARAILATLLRSGVPVLAPIYARGDEGRTRQILIECFKQGTWSPHTVAPDPHPTRDFLPESRWPHAAPLALELLGGEAQSES